MGRYGSAKVGRASMDVEMTREEERRGLTVQLSCLNGLAMGNSGCIEVGDGKKDKNMKKNLLLKEPLQL